MKTAWRKCVEKLVSTYFRCGAEMSHKLRLYDSQASQLDSKWGEKIDGTSRKN